jgi:hypothetical protein
MGKHTTFVVSLQDFSMRSKVHLPKVNSIGENYVNYTVARILDNTVIALSSCWEWQRCLVNGYGYISFNKQAVLVHRFLYEYYHGKIKDNEQLHHKCHNRKCVNIFHLKQVTQKEHSQEHLKTHCKRGHRFTPENTIIRKDGKQCHICIKMHRMNYYFRHRERISAKMKLRDRRKYV